MEVFKGFKPPKIWSNKKTKSMKVVGVLMASTTFIWMELMEFASGNSKPPISR